jgi:predicted enzyme related to lactoylglutathione lyase
MNRAAGKQQAVKKVVKSMPAKEFFRLKYLRFNCRDLTRTVDFYKSLGMTVDFEGLQEKFNVSAFAKEKAQAVKTMESEHVKKNSDLNDEPDIEQQENPTRVLALSFSPQVNVPGTKGQQSQRVQIVFEEDLDYLQDVQFKNLKNDANQKDANTFGGSDDKVRVKRQYEYMVIYVHFLARLLKRMNSKGFEIVLDITSFENVKIAILKDPNNIQIRLIEMPDGYLNEQGPKQWFAKLGYYSLPSSDADQTVLMYESYFHTSTQNPVPRPPEKDRLGMAEQTNPIHSIRKLGAAQTVKQALTKGSGFRLVDMEEFVVGLTNSVFYWLGNDMRTNTCCLCLTEVSNADTGVALTSYDPETSPLKSIGRIK